MPEPGSPSYWREAEQRQASPFWDLASPLGSDLDALAAVDFENLINNDNDNDNNANNDQFDFFDPRLDFFPTVLNPAPDQYLPYNLPPANQPASHSGNHNRRFGFRIHDSSSPDPFADSFSDFVVTDSPAAEDRGIAQASTFVDLTTPSPQMAPSRKRKLEEAEGSTARRSGRTATPKIDPDKIEVVDLENVEGQKDYEDFQAKQKAEMIRKQNEEAAKKPVRLADFQCIICMDSPTDLTVTHCGHLFCAECLHSALNAGDKRTCPVCRTLIGMPKPGQNKPPRNGAFVLEMKLMTANKKGKQPALR